MNINFPYDFNNIKFNSGELLNAISINTHIKKLYDNGKYLNNNPRIQSASTSAQGIAYLASSQEVIDGIVSDKYIDTKTLSGIIEDIDVTSTFNSISSVNITDKIVALHGEFTTYSGLSSPYVYKLYFNQGNPAFTDLGPLFFTLSPICSATLSNSININCYRYTSDNDNTDFNILSSQVVDFADYSKHAHIVYHNKNNDIQSIKWCAIGQKTDTIYYTSNIDPITYNFTGVIDGSLDNYNNYFPQGIPTSADTVILDSTRINNPSSGTVTCEKFIVNDSLSTFNVSIDGGTYNTVVEFNDSTNNNTVINQAIFNDSSQNHSECAIVTFNNTSMNYGACTLAIFNDTSNNASTCTSATFNNTSVNSLYCSSAIFNDAASNMYVCNYGIFNDGAYNYSTCTTAVFNHEAWNAGSCEYGTFNNDSINYNICHNAIFNNNSYNNNSESIEYIEDATFNDNSFNMGTCSHAIFNDYSYNNGQINIDATFNNYSHNEYNMFTYEQFNFKDYSYNNGKANWGYFYPLNIGTIDNPIWNYPVNNGTINHARVYWLQSDNELGGITNDIEYLGYP